MIISYSGDMQKKNTVVCHVITFYTGTCRGQGWRRALIFMGEKSCCVSVMMLSGEVRRPAQHAGVSTLCSQTCADVDLWFCFGDFSSEREFFLIASCWNRSVQNYAVVVLFTQLFPEL